MTFTHLDLKHVSCLVFATCYFWWSISGVTNIQNSVWSLQVRLSHVVTGLGRNLTQTLSKVNELSKDWTEGFYLQLDQNFKTIKSRRKYIPRLFLKIIQYVDFNLETIQFNIIPLCTFENIFAAVWLLMLSENFTPTNWQTNQNRVVAICVTCIYSCHFEF